MLRSRIIPCLLIHKGGLVKTVGFKDPKYVGDPINAVKIFNEKEVDELIVLDIDATVKEREPDFETIKKLAVECRMPLCYGGGVSSVEHAKKIINLGAEKLAINSAAIKDISILEKIGKAVGMQSVVVVIDVRKNKKDGYDIYIRNGTQKVEILFEDYLQKLNQIGVGEIVINSIDADGTMTGYDMRLVDIVREAVDMPLTVLGGAGKYDDIKGLIQKHHIIGAAAGSLFVFKGKFRAVLISYPLKDEKKNILSN
ncbi:AglZ/HisF2 family acetamidino modification protein [Sediminibacterium ginsengisoli]|uniref:imidazole glycerol-phosphate synthase n=1 Tax=Sediminibacterium ginsengisoli TaxID=413434 RepID=A0A1T4N479_9BACT|nr:AglZ/HisF2 family acetamidino modification protein [Sediminibacterium ginsengisoli]SJZ74170.1 cyclase [Sediminibacterium ginsengisoli]